MGLFTRHEGHVSHKRDETTMPQPPLSQVHIDRALTNISVAYAQDTNEFIHRRVFPLVNVPNKSNNYFIFTKSFWLRTEAKKRAPSTESAGSGFNLETGSFDCDRYAVHQDLDDMIVANQDDPLDLRRSATLYVTYQILLQMELDWQSKFFAASTWTGSTTGADITPGTTWDDAASTPIEDIKAQKISIQEKTGRTPNKLVLGPEVWNKLSDHPDLVDRIKHTQRGVLTKELAAQLFEVEEVLVPIATRNTAGENATATMDFVYGKNALLVYAAPAPGLMTPSGGYVFNWTGYLGAAAGGVQVSRFRVDTLKSDRIEGEAAYAMKVVAADVGAFFSSAVA